MGRQIAFVLTEGDELAFFRALGEKAEYRLEPMCMDSTKGAALDAPSGGIGSLIESYALWRPELDPTPTRTRVGDRWCVFTDAQLVEFNRTSFDGLRPDPGRLYIGTNSPRPADFVRWFERLTSLIRRTGRRDKSGVYWGVDAQQRWDRYVRIAGVFGEDPSAP
jgi:hypothetical protein